MASVLIAFDRCRKNTAFLSQKASDEQQADRKLLISTDEVNTAVTLPLYLASS